MEFLCALFAVGFFAALMQPNQLTPNQQVEQQNKEVEPAPAKKASADTYYRPVARQGINFYCMSCHRLSFGCPPVCDLCRSK